MAATRYSKASVKKVRAMKKVSLTEAEKSSGAGPLNRFNHAPGFRANIGARNPYVLAIRKLVLLNEKTGEKKYNPENFKPKDLEKMLKLAFKEYPLEHLFDPKFDSPVYDGLYSATARLAQSCPQRYMDSLRVLNADSRKTGGASPLCANMTQSNDMTGIINGLPVKLIDWVQKNTGFEFNDPMQGCLADCWFIGSLSAVAWAETNQYGTCLTRGQPIKVYPTCLAPKNSTISTSMTFYTDSTGIIPYFAYMNPHMIRSNATTYECWPSLYEKCFAAYYQYKAANPGSCPIPYPENDTPVYSVLNFGASYDAIVELTGRTMLPSTEKYTRDYIIIGDGQDNNTQIISDLKTGPCNAATTPMPDGKFIATQLPTTAYTYLSQDLVYQYANQSKYKDNSDKVDTVTYDNAGLSANHCYTVLGLFQEAGKTYVVLRNPWGFFGEASWFKPYVQQHRANTLTSIPNHSYLRNPVAAEGIFALDSICFMRYFEAFGWALK